MLLHILNDESLRVSFPEACFVTNFARKHSQAQSQSYLSDTLQLAAVGGFMETTIIRDALHTNPQANTDNPAVKFKPNGVYILTTNVQSCLMAAAFTTHEGAMAAAVGWMECEAQTRLSGSLEERYAKARQHFIRQGGQMEIIKSSVRCGTE